VVVFVSICFSLIRVDHEGNKFIEILLNCAWDNSWWSTTKFCPDILDLQCFMAYGQTFLWCSHYNALWPTVKFFFDVPLLQCFMVCGQGTVSRLQSFN